MHANDLHLGAHRLDVVRHTGNQATPANGDEDRVQRPLVLAQQLHGDGALSGDHFGVIKWVNKGQTLLGAKFHRMVVGVGVAVAVQQHLATQRFHRFHLQSRCGDRHDDDRPSAQLFCTQSHALRMVSRRGTHHTFGKLGGAELHHFVVGTAQFEAEHRLLVFTFQQHLVVQSFAEDGGSV